MPETALSGPPWSQAIGSIAWASDHLLSHLKQGIEYRDSRIPQKRYWNVDTNYELLRHIGSIIYCKHWQINIEEGSLSFD
jgi:plasmid replication initiation protein